MPHQYDRPSVAWLCASRAASVWVVDNHAREANGNTVGVWWIVLEIDGNDIDDSAVVINAISQQPISGDGEGSNYVLNFPECLQESGTDPSRDSLWCGTVSIPGLTNILLDPVREGLLVTTNRGEVIAIDRDNLKQKLIADDFLVDNSIIAPNGGYLLGAKGNQIVKLNLVTLQVSTMVSVRDAQNVILGGITDNDKLVLLDENKVYIFELRAFNSTKPMCSDDVQTEIVAMGNNTFPLPDDLTYLSIRSVKPIITPNDKLVVGS